MDIMVLKAEKQRFLYNVKQKYQHLVHIFAQIIINYLWSPSVSSNNALSWGRPSGYTTPQTPTYAQEVPIQPRTYYVNKEEENVWLSCLGHTLHIHVLNIHPSNQNVFVFMNSSLNKPI